jgi:thiamine-phosphate pyrophosphorylase
VRLVLVTNRKLASYPQVGAGLAGERFLDAVREAVAGGMDTVILREHDATAKELFALATECKAIAHAGGAKFIVNHSLDVALAVEADGVHLGWRSLPAREVRKLAPRPFLVGVSTHSGVFPHRQAGRAGIKACRPCRPMGENIVGAAERCADDPVDYLFLGPIFPTPSKAGLVEPLGVEAIRAAKKAVKIPVIAIGGIKPGNVREVMAAGADGVAVISHIMGAASPREAAQELKAAMG